MSSEKASLSAFNNLLFPKIFLTFRMAIQPNKLAIAFSALVTICAVGWLMDAGRTVVTTPGTQGQITELQIYLNQPDQVPSYIDEYEKTGERTGVFATLWDFTAKRFHEALLSMFTLNIPVLIVTVTDFFKAECWAFKYHFFYCIIFFVIKLAVISIAGGSLCRITVLQFARGEKPGLTEALHFGTGRFTSFFAAPLTLIGIIILTGLCVFILGLIGNISIIGELIIGICTPLIFIAGTLIAIILTGLVAGFNLMFPAVAYDGSDCFDAISRSYSYVYARPWRLGFYTLLAAVYGAICYMFVRFFAFLLLASSRWFLQIGVRSNTGEGVNKLAAIWPEPSLMNFGTYSLATLNWSQSIAAFLIHLFTLVIIGLAGAYLISFYFSANTIIYALMRNKVDNTALEDIYAHFDDIEAEPGVTENNAEETLS